MNADAKTASPVEKPGGSEKPAKRDQSVLALVKRTFSEAGDDKIPRLAASLAYYTLLSLSPLLVLAVAVAGLVFGEDAARGQIGQQLQEVFGPEAGEAIQSMLANAKKPESGVLGSIVGIVVLLFGASGVFGELQDSLNTIWEVQPKPGRGILGIVKDRFLSFTMVLGVAFLLLVSLVISAGLAAVGKWFTSLDGVEWIWQIANFAISLGLITLLFALVFKVIPDVKIRLRDVWLGALVTGALFTLGKFLIGLYVGKAGVASPYGAAGSLVVLVVWVFYSAHILFIGAEFTQVHVRAKGASVEPSRGAVAVTEEAKSSAGYPTQSLQRGVLR
ncbi:MAG TPA: YihY/virulence factor BrkB family protein [Polyangiaceae bacterium]|nr:YihY/virulence factor BrkB family protein [Polyangiaceae bacterium]